MPEIPGVRSCGLYLPGHQIHYIQARLAANDRDSPRETGALVSVHADGELVIEIDGEHRVYWNHDPDRLRSLVEDHGARVVVQERWGVLRIPRSSGSSLVCIARGNADHRPCPEQPPEGDLVELLHDAGGFVIRGRDL